MTGWEREGDMAESVARQLHTEHLEKIAADGAPFVDEEPVMLATTKSLFDKITFRWRSDERSQLDRIRASADTVVAHLFDDAKMVIDNFYAELREAEINPDTGMVLRERDGRIVWKTDEHGKPIEKWSQMTGQDIERCLLDLARIKTLVASQVHELLMEAVFAKHLHDDQYQDAYAELVEETIPGRNAYAARKTRVDKYHAFFRYYLWSTADVLMKEITNFSRVLERVGYWRSMDVKRPARGE
jgi:hypothetical protein